MRGLDHFGVHYDRHSEPPCTPQLCVLDELNHEVSDIGSGGRAAGEDTCEGGLFDVIRRNLSVDQRVWADAAPLDVLALRPHVLMEMRCRSFIIPMRRQGVAQESQEPPFKPDSLLSEGGISDPDRVHEDELGGRGGTILFDRITQASRCVRA